MSAKMPVGRSYKPTLDQLVLTRLIDFDLVRRRGLPCFETLQRALQFLAKSIGKDGVYPPS